MFEFVVMCLLGLLAAFASVFVGYLVAMEYYLTRDYKMIAVGTFLSVAAAVLSVYFFIQAPSWL